MKSKTQTQYTVEKNIQQLKYNKRSENELKLLCVVDFSFFQKLKCQSISIHQYVTRYDQLTYLQIIQYHIISYLLQQYLISQQYLVEIINYNKMMIMMNLLRINYKMSIYSSGTNCYVSLASLVTSQLKTLPDNIYIHQNTKINEIPENAIFRVIIRPQLDKHELKLNINELKSNPLMSRLLKNAQKLQNFQASKVIVDCQLSNKERNEDDLKQIKNKLIEIQKIFIDGLKLPLSFAISKHNYQKQWLKLLSKKKKAINSNVIYNKVNFNELIFEQGYNLEHIFLSNYVIDDQKIKRTNLLSEGNMIKFPELCQVLKIIMFKGKIVLRAGEHYQENKQLLQKQFKESGFRKEDQLRDDSWISAL